MEGEHILYSIKHPFRMMLISSSGGGKTTLALELLANRSRIIDTAITDIFYVYKHDQPLFDIYRKSNPKIKFITDIDLLDNLVTGSKPSIVVLDDLMVELTAKSGAAYLIDWFTRKSRHLSCSLILLLHNAFPENLRTCSLNTTITVLWDNARDRSQVIFIGRQLYPSKQGQFVEAFYDAVTGEKHGHLVIDYHSETPEHLCCRNFLIPRTKNMKYYTI